MTLIGNTNTSKYLRSDRQEFVDEVLSAANTDFESAYAFFLDDLKNNRIDEEWEVEVSADKRVLYSYPKSQKLKKVFRIYSDPNYQFCTVQINLWGPKGVATNPEAKIFNVHTDHKNNFIKGNLFFEELCTRAENRDEVLASIERGVKFARDRDLALNDYKTTKSESQIQSDTLQKENADLKSQLSTLSTQFQEMKELMYAQMNQKETPAKSTRKTNK